MGDRRYTLPPNPSLDLAYLKDHAGQLMHLSGLVFQGGDQSVIVMLPSGDMVSILGPLVWKPELEDLAEVMRRTDDPQIFLRDETGLLKTIVRKVEYSISGAVMQQIWQRDGYRCMFCGKALGTVQVTCDHWIPLEAGGTSEPSNLLSVCRLHQKQKADLMPEEYCRKNGYDYAGLTEYLAGRCSANFIAHLQ